MKKLMFNAVTVAALAAALAVAMPAMAAGTPVSTPPGQNKLLCFDGTTDGGFGGICTLIGKGAKGPATLDNTDSNAAGDYSGVYIANTTLSGQLLSKVTQLSYNYTGTTVPTPGDLSLNVPLDTNNDGVTDLYAFIDAAYDPGTGGRVDVIHDVVCGIYVGGTDFYPNWAALVAAHPTWKVATDAVPFVIAERTPSEGPAFWTVSNVTLGKGGK
jgi:hypothetical protein